MPMRSIIRIALVQYGHPLLTYISFIGSLLVADVGTRGDAQAQQGSKCHKARPEGHSRAIHREIVPFAAIGGTRGPGVQPWAWASWCLRRKGRVRVGFWAWWGCSGALRKPPETRFAQALALVCALMQNEFSIRRGMLSRPVRDDYLDTL